MYTYRINEDFSVEILNGDGSTYIYQTIDPRDQTPIETEPHALDVAEFLLKMENDRLESILNPPEPPPPEPPAKDLLKLWDIENGYNQEG